MQVYNLTVAEERASKRDHKDHNAQNLARWNWKNDSLKTILPANYIVLVISRMTRPWGLLEGEGRATCFAPLLDRLKEAIHD